MKDRLKDEYQKRMIEILSSHPRVERAVLFGSRAMGTYTTTSDVDIALFGDELTLDDLAQLTEQMERLPMPQKVDLVLFHRIENENLIEHIQQHGIEWFSTKRDE